ncbi:hypothetical protein [Pyrinomonas methylaliphatogenes]|jgi:hypothetical protein|uniref:Uncharacterized protein n=1 Tax=Pyrinomonas methylaliphatogenes TaxID=454194 RepID=A0A0B6WXG0_9BACT|nr:hypothetical protein [Pyrinomonas methylaliphatogenes]CDM64860.1 hypothetical protein PYK22_00855 [Pyrinomonas methylaliphatogenes]
MSSKAIDILCWIVGLISLAFGIWQFYRFATYRNPQTGQIDWQGGTSYLWLAIAGIAIACACALVFFLRHVNKDEEIHITQ